MNQKAPRFTSEQEACITFPGQTEGGVQSIHLVIEAGAGAGKTAVLAERVRWKITAAPEHHRCAPQELVLATFTRAADRELRERVHNLLLETGEPRWARAASLLQISTIDSLLMTLFECYYQNFWESAFLNQDAAQTAASHTNYRYQMTSAPQPELIDEEIARAELQSGLGPYFQGSLLRHSGLDDALILDFLLAGALKGAAVIGPSHGTSPRDQILSFLLSETCLLLNEKQPAIIQDSIHPAMPRVLNELMTWARSCHLQRIRRGRITHTDRLVFLHNLICTPAAVRQGTPFATHDVALPFAFKELIVDEYQDTNPAQHELLLALVTQAKARMVVVGDPKQSLYGFRRAKVGVFHELKSDPKWHHVELVRNFRSSPALLQEINVLSRLALDFEDSSIPPAFWNTQHGVAARKSMVRSLDLKPGRPLPVATDCSEENANRRPAYVTVMSHSLNPIRYPNGMNLPDGITFADLSGELLVSAVQCELSAGTPPRDCVVLCETNRDCDFVVSTLAGSGIKAATESSSANRVAREAAEPALPQRVAITLCALLIPGLDDPICSTARSSTVALFEVLTSPLVSLSTWAAASICAQLRSSNTSAELAVSSGSLSRKDREVWRVFFNRLNDARRVALSNLFVAWKLMVVPVRSEHEGLHPNTGMGPSAQPGFFHMLDAWALRFAAHFENELWRQRLQDPRTAEGWTNPITDLRNLLPKDLISATHISAPPPDPDALPVMTVHGAKGLQWPVVFFFPSQKKAQKSAVFRCLDFSDRSVVQWLTQPVEPLELFARSDWNLQVPKGEPQQDASGHPPSHHDRKPLRVRMPDAQPPDQTAANELELQEKAEKMFERSRVFYTAITRAAERLYLFAPKGQRGYKKSIRDLLADLTPTSSEAQVRKTLSGFVPFVLGSYLDDIFALRSELPPGKKKGKKPSEPWLTSEWANPLPNQINRSVAYCDRAAPSCSERSQRVALARKTEQNMPSASVHLRTGAQNFKTSEKATENLTEHPAASYLNGVATDADSWLGTWGPTQAPKTSTEPRAAHQSLPQSEGHTSDLSPAHQGLLYHAEREYLGSAGQQDALGELEQAAKIVLKEFEIWTEKPLDTVAPKNLILCPVPARHIVDLIAVVRTVDLPAAFQTSEVYFAVPEHEHLERAHDRAEPPEWLAVIVDYKTGLESEAHHTQMRRYLQAVGAFLRTGAGARLLCERDSAITNVQKDRIGLAGYICYVRRAQTAGIFGSASMGLLSLRPVALEDPTPASGNNN